MKPTLTPFAARPRRTACRDETWDDAPVTLGDVVRRRLDLAGDTLPPRRAAFERRPRDRR
ncbi:MAG: hypothetical protein AAF322_15490 [Pseudomonadota bacterium]